MRGIKLLAVLLLFVCATLVFVACDFAQGTYGIERNTSGIGNWQGATEDSTVHEHTVVIDEAYVPTCTVNGRTEGSHCSECGEVIVSQDILVAIGHLWDDGIVEAEPTCTETGTKTVTCEECGDQKIVTIEKVPHAWDDGVVMTEATCTGKGEKAFVCTVCNDSKVEYIAKLPHEYSSEWTIDVETSCSNAGSKSRHCTVCDSQTNVTTIPSLPHTWDGGTVESYQSCTTDGVVVYYCLVCYTSKRNTEYATGHSAGNWVINKDATCSTSGSKSQYCTVCNAKVKTETINATGHIWNVDNVCTSCSEKMVFTEGLSYQLSSDGDSYTVLGLGKAKDMKIVIPSSYKGLPVTAIAASSFDYTDITSLVIPDSVTSIGKKAFKGCESLISVDLGQGVQSIGAEAFMECVNLRGIVIPDSVTDLGSEIFEDCKNMSSVTIGKGMTYISSYMFNHCESLKEVTIPSNIETIGYAAFKSCYRLSSIVIPDTVTTMNGEAFRACYALKTAKVGRGITKLAGSVFSSCEKLESITLPNSIISIGDYALYACTSLEDIYFDGSVEEWRAIEKDWRWDMGGTDNYLVHCTDGDI